VRAAVLLVLAGCGGVRDGAARDGAFRIGPLPPSWQRVPGDGVAFHDPTADAMILVNASCRESLDAPLTALRSGLLLGLTDRRVLEEREAMLAGRAALRSEVAARLDGVPVRLTTYVLKKDGCVYDLVYAAPPDRFGGRSADFERFVAQFSTVRA
jgi:hypothetical protein